MQPDAAAKVEVTAARAETRPLPALVMIKIEPTKKSWLVSRSSEDYSSISQEIQTYLG